MVSSKDLKQRKLRCESEDEGQTITSNMDSTSFTQRKGGCRSDLGPRAGLLYIKERMQEKHKIKEERTGEKLSEKSTYMFNMHVIKFNVKI